MDEGRPVEGVEVVVKEVVVVQGGEVVPEEAELSEDRTTIISHHVEMLREAGEELVAEAIKTGIVK